jgi:hypothetical protein
VIRDGDVITTGLDGVRELEAIVFEADRKRRERVFGNRRACGVGESRCSAWSEGGKASETG